MKKIKLLLVALTLCFTTLVTAQESIKEVDTLNIEIANVLKNIPFDVNEDVSAKAFIKFNNENKIVDVNVICENYTIAKFIKTRLIRSTIKSKKFNTGDVYSLPIKIMSKGR